MATNAMPMQPSPAINIRVFRNGDEFYSGKRFVISTRTTKDFDSFLNEVTWGLKASFGAVRKLHTPVNGHKIQDLSALENNNTYVAAGTEKFKKKSYNELRRLGTLKASTFAGPIQPVTHSKIRRSARIRHIYVGTKTIFIYRNGDDKELPMRMLLRYRTLQNFESVLTEINGKVNLLNGVAIRRLYKMTGERVSDCTQIDSEGKYVAAGTERFKKVAYGQWEPSAPLSPRHVKKPLPPIKAKPPPQKSSLPAKPKPTTVKKQKAEKKKKPVEKSPEQKEADSVFHHKPTTVKRSREKDQHLNYDDDPNAVFRAKEGNSETEGASEVEDTRETAIDLPIDQIAAEEVDEEIGENLPMNQESKSPEPYSSQSPERKTPANQTGSEVPDDYPEEKSKSPEDKPTAFTMDSHYGEESPTKEPEAINTNNNAGDEDTTSYDGQQFTDREDQEQKDVPESNQFGEETFNERASKNASPSKDDDESHVTTEPTTEDTNPTSQDDVPTGQDDNPTAQDDVPTGHESPCEDSNPTAQDESPRQDSNPTAQDESPGQDSNPTAQDESPGQDSNSATQDEESPGQDPTTGNNSSDKDSSTTRDSDSGDNAGRKDTPTEQAGGDSRTGQESRTDREKPFSQGIDAY